MILVILGRQPAIGYAELEALFGTEAVIPFGPSTALVEASADQASTRPIGSAIKIAKVTKVFESDKWQSIAPKAVKSLEKSLPNEGKVTLGISAYDFNVNAREVQKTGIIIKQRLKKGGGSLRLIPQTEAALNSAQTHHNKLGTAANKREVILAKGNGETVMAETFYVQDIDAYTFRDRSRPKRDARVGMLPPKLAQTMISLAGRPVVSFATEDIHFSPVPSTEAAWLAEDCLSEASSAGDQAASVRETRRRNVPSEVANETTGRPTHSSRLLDPFCGTGVLLQEAALMGYEVYGTDLEPRMIDYSKENLEWLKRTHRIDFTYTLEQGDATTKTWQPPLDSIACETYLGQPFSAEPSPEKLREVMQTCNSIVREFLKNLAPQIASGTPLCLGVPAWHVKNRVYHLQILDSLAEIGYNRRDFTHAQNTELVYRREGQVVGRELLVLTRS